MLPAAERFVLLFGGDAALDRETGLVWEKSPQATPSSWNQARFDCTAKTTGGRKGWRPPSVHELASLVDPSVAAPGPTLPPGHPFTNVQSALYWSATTSAENPNSAWAVYFNTADVFRIGKPASVARAWCVRGGMNADAY